MGQPHLCELTFLRWTGYSLFLFLKCLEGRVDFNITDCVKWANDIDGMAMNEHVNKLQNWFHKMSNHFLNVLCLIVVFLFIV